MTELLKLCITMAVSTTDLTSLHKNREMAARALATQEASEMAAAMIHKKERLPTSEIAPDLLVLFSHRRRFTSPSPLRNPKLCLAQYEP